MYTWQYENVLVGFLQNYLLPSSAQAQAQLEDELALILISPAPTHQPRLVVKQFEISKTSLATIVALAQNVVRKLSRLFSLAGYPVSWNS